MAGAEAELPVSEMTDSDMLLPGALPQLEEHLKSQAASADAAYDARVNSAILRIYQFYPHLLNQDIVLLMLTKAIMTLPEPNFHLVTCLLPETVLATPQVTRLSDMEAFLQTGRFNEFWAAAGAAETRSALDKVAGFDDAVRTCEFRSLCVCVCVCVCSCLPNVAAPVAAAARKGRRACVRVVAVCPVCVGRRPC